MKLFRIALLTFLSLAVAVISFIIIYEEYETPFSRSLAPLYQELGRPIKSFDRIVGQLLPIDSIDEKMIGDEIKLSFAENSKYEGVKDDRTVKYLNSLINFAVREINSAFEYQVYLVSGPPNACAMPGGVICVTDELMEILENEAELVAILCHEIGHIERGHLFDKVKWDMLQRKVKAITLITFVSDVINAVARYSFSKTQEDEADEYAFRLMLNLGYDPMAISNAFEKIMLESNNENGMTNPISDFFMTHPHTEHRIEKFRSRALLWKQNNSTQRMRLGTKAFLERSFTFMGNMDFLDGDI